MKKSNVILQAAVASALLAMFGSANAATAVTATSVKYASEQFAGTTPSAAVFAPTFNVVTSTAVPAGSTITVMIELTGGRFAAAPVGSVNNTAGAGVVSTVALGAVNTTTLVTLGSTIVGTTAAAAGVLAAPTPTASNANVVVLTMTTTAALGIGGTIATVTTPEISASGLASTANTVTATATILVGAVAAPVGAAVPTSGTLEAASGATTVATSAQGVTIAAVPNTATAKIDLTAGTPSTKFTAPAVSAVDTGSTTLIKLGTLTITDGTAKVVAAGNAAYTSAGKATNTTTTTVTAPAGFFAALGTTGVITVRAPHANACGGAASVTSATFGTAALAAAATSVSTAATALAAGTAFDVCMSVNGTTAIATGTPSLTATLGAAAAQDSVDALAATNLLTLTQNGQTKTVRNYVPSTVTGYPMTVRVTNTGVVAAPVTITMIGESGAQIGVPYTTTSFAAGETRRILQAEVEAGVGNVPASTARPRLVVTAPTDGMEVQTFINTPGQGYTNLSGTE